MTQVYSTKTPNMGLAVPSTGCPDYETGNATALFSAAITALDNAVLNGEVKTAAGTIASTIGKVILKAGAAVALTLAAPVAGSVANGGQDFQELTIIADDAFAYTVTTPANAINASKHVITWAAAIGNGLKLVAYNGGWLTADALNGVTLS
jgi:hypothetical protein